MAGVYESGPGWFSDGHNTDRWRGGGVQGHTEGEGLMGLRRGRGRRENWRGREGGTVWQLLLKLLFQPSSSHTHTRFPYSMGLSIYIMIFMMYILYFLSPNPKITPKQLSQNSFCIYSKTSKPFSSWGQEQKSPHKNQTFWVLLSFWGHYVPSK